MFLFKSSLTDKFYDRYILFAMKQKTNLCVVFLDYITLHCLQNLIFLALVTSLLILLRTLNMTFNLFVAYKYFYGLHYSMFVLSGK